MMTAQYQTALHSYAEGRYEEAMQQFSELLQSDPHNPKLHIWLGATFRKAGKVELAQAQYRQVLTLTEEPDLLDLANTSLAQIQNRLDSTAQGRGAFKSTDFMAVIQDLSITNINQDRLTDTQEITSSINTSSRVSVNGNAVNGNTQNGSTKLNGNSSNGVASNINILKNLDHIHDLIDEASVKTSDSTPLASPLTNGANVTNAFPHGDSQNISSGSAAIPPPPAVAMLLRQKIELEQPEQTSQDVIVTDSPWEQESLPKATTVSEYIHDDDLTASLNKAVTDIREVTSKIEKKSRATKKSHRVKSDDQLSNGSSEILTMADLIAPEKPQGIALEDMFKFSSIGQRITLWGTLVATIPTVILGVVAYQVGDNLLTSKVKQGQRNEVISIANRTSNFLNQQATDVAVLQKLLSSSDQISLPKVPTVIPNPNSTAPNEPVVNRPPNVAPNQAANPLASLPIAQQRQYKQQLTNRLNLYRQAYPEYSSIALFSVNGELLAQSSKAQTLPTLSPAIRSQVSLMQTVLLTNPVVGKEGDNIYAISMIKSSAAQMPNLILQVEIPLQKLARELANGSFNSDINGTSLGNANSFYVIDSNNRYVTGSRAVKVGAEALGDFTVLTSLRASQTVDVRDVNRSDRNAQMLAYAPVMNTQDNMLNWAVFVTADKPASLASNQNLLLVVAIGIASTPLFVAIVAYAMSRSLSARLQAIRMALWKLKKSYMGFQSLDVEGNDELADISLSINTMAAQFQAMLQKQEKENQRLQIQVVKLFKVLSKLAREEQQEVAPTDISDQKILYLGKKVRAEIVQQHNDVEKYRQQQEQIQTQLTEMLREVQTLASGELPVALTAIDSNFDNLPVVFDGVLQGLQNVVGQVKSSAKQVNIALGQNEHAIANLALVSQRQVDAVSRSLNTVQMAKLSANTIMDDSQQLSHSAHLFAEKLSDSDRSIDAVMSKISELQNTISTTAKRVKHLGVASQKIAKAISSINEIAIQTNFLAINATLEASRSGDVNSKFVIVAEEVGELAARSVAAGKEVESLLSNIQQETNAVMSAVESGSSQISESETLAGSARENLQQIAQISSQIDGLMVSIAAATTSQSQTSEGLANLMTDISHMAKRTLDYSSEATTSIKETKQHAGDLQKTLSNFKGR
jgi:twitching motility protein PilJ